MESCELCSTPGGEPVWADEHCRVVLVGGAEGLAYPGFCRVIWNSHVAEMSDLPADAAHHLLRVVLATEQAVQKEVAPDKINLASLGNVVPHLHWHVIPRWQDDRNFPQPIWAEALRNDPPHLSTKTPQKVALHAAINAAMTAI